VIVRWRVPTAVVTVMVLVVTDDRSDILGQFRSLALREPDARGLGVRLTEPASCLRRANWRTAIVASVRSRYSCSGLTRIIHSALDKA